MPEMNETDRSQSSVLAELTALRKQVDELVAAQTTWQQQEAAHHRALQQAVAALQHERAARQQLENELQQAQKMAAIGILAGGIAHDFNNILGVMIGYTELLNNELTTEHQWQSHLQEILIAGQRAKSLVHQILTFSRRHDQERQPIQLHQLVTETLKLLRASLPATIMFQPQIDPHSGTIRADPTQMHQVVMNLCTNAEHAMRQTGGTLDVSLEAVDVDIHLAAPHLALTPGPYLRLIVRDTGHGLSAENCDRIFEPFYTTKGEGEGTGMGLAVVQGIVLSHGGVIQVDSRPGAGSTFTVYLPRLIDTSTSATPPEAPLPCGQGTVLFVDDEAALAQAGCAMLTRLGYTVTTCSSSVEALKAFQITPHQFDVVITDQTMPEMTGEALAQAMRQLRPELPIILCTGYSHVMTAEKAQALEFNAFLLKPVTIRELGQTVAQVLTQS